MVQVTALLVLTSGSARHEAVLHINLLICVCEGMQLMVWIEPDKNESMLHLEGYARYVERVYAVVGWGRCSACECVTIIQPMIASV